MEDPFLSPSPSSLSLPRSGLRKSVVLNRTLASLIEAATRFFQHRSFKIEFIEAKVYATHLAFLRFNGRQFAKRGVSLWCGSLQIEVLKLTCYLPNVILIFVKLLSLDVGLVLREWYKGNKFVHAITLEP